MRESIDTAITAAISGFLMALLMIAYRKFKVWKEKHDVKEAKKTQNKNGCLITFLILIGLVFVAIIGAVIYAVNSQ